MVQLNIVLFFALSAVATNAAPLQKRIAQVIVDSTQKWEQACLKAGGGQQCNPVSVTAFSTLLAAPGPCEQQNAADSMIALAKQLNNDAEMIRLTQIFAQQPRNSPTSQSVPYCQTAPKNAELNGLFQCQFASTDKTTFVGGLKVGAAGTIPFGQSSPVNPAGSCPASPAGPVPDGQQLTDLVTNSGVGSTAASSNNSSSGSAASSNNSKNANTSSASAVAAPSASGSASTSTSTASSSGDFHLQNGKDAQALNAKFATLTANSSCTDGDVACVGSAFAQCVGGKFVTTSCAATLTCAALPLVNKPGTSVTCTTTSDAQARIAATGATGGSTGSNNSSSGSAASSNNSKNANTSSASAVAGPSASGSASTSTPTASSSGDFHLQNGKDAQALNAKFATLTANSSCTDGDVACVGSAFAQCVGGKFVTTSCAATLTCAALPLVNKPGTSVTCTTTSDAQARIAATGATGGITGSA